MSNTASPKVVLVTGANGFVGSHVALAFLKAGWLVKGTTRSQEKGDALKTAKAFKPYGDQLSFVIIKDLIDGDFTEAVKGVDAIAHVASPFHFGGGSWDKDYADPAIKGTTNVLEAAAKEARIKHVVVTSSFASVGEFSTPATAQAGKVYTEKNWNPVTYEAAADTDNKGVWYCASKTLAEHAAYDVQKTASFSLSTICPPMILGPHVSPIDKLSGLNESSGQLWSLISGDAKEIPDTAFPAFADVRDVATAHVVSTEKQSQGRFLVSSGEFDNVWIADFAKKTFPEIASRIPAASAPSLVGAGKVYHLDASKAAKELGIAFRSKEETFGDSITQYLQLEKEGH